MAHEIDMSNSRANMAYVGQKPWHGFCNELPENASLEVWSTAAGFDWKALVTEIVAKGDDDIKIDSHKALIRSDTKDVLSVVSKNYKPVQPQEVLGFFSDLVVGLDAGFKMETAGCLRGGRKIWALAKNVDGFSLDKTDHIEQYLLMATSFDRSLPTVAQLTSTRVVCANTLRVATADKSDAIRVTHNRNFDVELAKRTLGIKDRWQKFAEQCAKMADTKITEDDCRRFLAECVAESNPHKTTDDILEDDDNEIFNRLMELNFSAPGQNLATSTGTVWGALNAVTYWVDHDINAKSQDNRLDSAWFGRGARVKQFAHDRALELVG